VDFVTFIESASTGPIAEYTTYTSPFGPTTGREPWTNPASQDPLTMTGTLHVAPLSVERVK